MQKTCNPLNHHQCWPVTSTIASRCATAMETITVWWTVIIGSKYRKRDIYVAHICRSKTLSKKEPPFTIYVSQIHVCNSHSNRGFCGLFYVHNRFTCWTFKGYSNNNRANLEMKVDTGASMSIISEQTFNQVWPCKQRLTLQPTTVKLRNDTYSKEQLSTMDGQNPYHWLQQMNEDQVYYADTVLLKLTWTGLSCAVTICVTINWGIFMYENIHVKCSCK